MDLRIDEFFEEDEPIELILRDFENGEKGMTRWPADHDIGVYLCVGDHARLVGTARGRHDVPHLLRYLADEWDRLL